MRNASYLCLSRHTVYHFRYPLSSLLHPQGKTTYIKLSLETRNPRLALHLSRLLTTLAQSLLSNPQVLCMDYIEIRELLARHFKQQFETVREKIHKHGRLTSAIASTTSMDFTFLFSSAACAVYPRSALAF
jgi:hypothetical protein